MRPYASILGCLLACLALAGCDGDDAALRFYDAPKDPGPPVKYAVPAGWKELPSGGMRYAAFAVSPADPAAIVTVVPLGSEMGNRLPNVNRWEQQIGLSPSTEADLAKVTQPLEVGAVKGDLIDLTGPTTPPAPPVSEATTAPSTAPATSPSTAPASQRMIVAILPQGDRTWYFKLTGRADVVAEQKPNFDAFVRSIRFAAPAASAVSQAPATRPADPVAAFAPQPTSPQSTQDAAGQRQPIRWTVPQNAGWTQDPTPREMRHATFLIQSGARSGELRITRLKTGGFGSLLDNINRWRRDAGLSDPVTDAAAVPFEKTTVGGREAQVYDFTGTEPGPDGTKPRVRVAMVNAGPDTWFFRLQGSAELIEEQKGPFGAFLNSVVFEQ